MLYSSMESQCREFETLGYIALKDPLGLVQGQAQRVKEMSQLVAVAVLGS
jgi:hypothetical protein